MLRAYTENPAPGTWVRLWLKYVMFPGTNWVSRDKSRVVRMFLSGTADRPVRTLDCGCGNAYFSHQAVLRGAQCLGITIHEWENITARRCGRFSDSPTNSSNFDSGTCKPSLRTIPSTAASTRSCCST